MIGFIYIMSNPAYPGDLKIGQTKNDPEERRKDLGSTGVLHDYVLEYRALSEDYESLEREIHTSLAKQRVRPDREFFTISVPEAINKIREIAGDRIESDKVLFVSPEDLLRSEEERKKKAEEDRKAAEAFRVQMKKKIKEKKLLAEAKAKEKEDLAKFKDAEEKRIAELKEEERIKAEKEKVLEKEKELLEKYKKIFRPPKNILLFPFWIMCIPYRWADYGMEYGPKWKMIIYIPVSLIGIVLITLLSAGVIILLIEFLNLIGIE